MNTFSHKSMLFALSIVTVQAALLLCRGTSQAQAYNTATGSGALNYDTTGYRNLADGFDALYANTSGFDNTAVGVYSLSTNTTGLFNTANGAYALFLNTTGDRNVAFGCNSLYSNTTGAENTASGNGSLYTNTSGSYNTANGFGALGANTIGEYNTSIGLDTLFTNTTGICNVANGVNALYSNTTGSYNTAIGNGSLYTNSTGNGNIALGFDAGENIYTGSNNIEIGNPGASADTGIIRIGTDGTHKKTYVAGINGVTVSGGVAVYIDSNGQMGTLKSSRRFKFDIKSIGDSSSKLMDLRPVTFRYKEAAENGTHPIQFGLIAEEVAKVYPDLVQYDKQGKPFTVYYNLLTPMMLNELQKAHQEINSLKSSQQNQCAAVVSLQHATGILMMVVAALVVAIIASAVYILLGRMRRLPMSRSRQTEMYA